ncbi:eukaryotic release factor 3 [Heterostelium album PN500]|uniref:Eukaryotic release factor 3 n=1 Tax=Heterostelium pallidum (strain ATCC 26659 / Pp 5 / PN500) TaxID=670386 RepID=D3B568_HETP5|nr:eukaryotic release factor 3 [Heterostelium album PN500]EFA83433.1 eukaryotic release factor 3 [Heterostelium album PN500]|eukprot:XP_020435550.1 eukaryotic release factor 3 [Heterostelium album PN500]
MNPNASVFVPKFLVKPAATTPAPAPAATPAPAPAPAAATPAPEEKQSTTTTTTTTTTTSTPSASKVTASPPVEEQKPTESVFKVEDDDIEEEETDEITKKIEALPIQDVSDFKEDQREHVNIVFIGHVDAGKSTISGRIMVLTGQIDSHTLAKYEREAKENHRESWLYAFVMDTNEEERAKGKTVEVGRAHFETEKRRYTILDAPGHKNYVPNMISGAAQADVGILVVSSKKGEFEAGVDGGQTIEHARLAKMIGIKHLIVLVNKMDEPTVNWSKARYDEICEKITGHLKKCGFNPKKDFQFVPGSGYTSANIKDTVSKELCPWNTGVSLIETLDLLPQFERNESGALRVPIIDSFKDRGIVHVMGKVESGSITLGQQIFIMPGKTKVEVLSLSNESCNFRTGRTGENLRIGLKGIDDEQIRQGSILSEIVRQVPVVTEIEAIIVLIDLPKDKQLFTADYEAMFHAHTAVEECKIKSLIATIDMKTGNELKQKPTFARNGESIKARVVLSRAVCLEEFTSNPQLSRFTLRQSNKTIAFGKVVNVGKKVKEQLAAAAAALSPK